MKNKKIRKINKVSSAYLIRTLSPLHVGSGDSSYGVIDNLVQRDPNNNYPVIHSSSMKGALREFFEYRSMTKVLPTSDDVHTIFGYGNKSDRYGGDIEEGKNSSKHLAGLFDFDLGFLLSLPVRSDKAAYLSATTLDIVETFVERMELFDVDSAASLKSTLQSLLNLKGQKISFPLVFNKSLEGAILEEEDFKASHQEVANIAALEAIFGKNLAILSNEQFQELSDNLPVIARNKLENGESKNLWYEETVPRESRFYTIITKATWSDSPTSNSKSVGLSKTFDDTIQSQLIQLGANATVGYGKTKFTKLN